MNILHISKKTLIIVGILLLTAALIATGGVIARYVNHTDFEDTPVKAKAFYFTSDYLTEDNKTYNLNSSTQEIPIYLYNYESSIRFSEVKSTYTIKLETTAEGFTLNGNSTSEITETLDGGVAGEKKITLAGLQSGYTYKITVTANGGYVKTLSATFIINEEPLGLFMNVNSENDDYVILTVKAEGIFGYINVTFPDGLIPDDTDPILDEINNYNSGVYKSGDFQDLVNFIDDTGSEPKAKQYRFFKASNYSNGDFTVTMTTTSGTIVAVPFTP